MQDMEISNYIINFCHLLYMKNMVNSTGGNVSLRKNDVVFITSTGSLLGKLTPEMIIKVKLDGSVLGSGKPSKETAMHLGIYNARPGICGIVHPHPPYSIAYSCIVQPYDMEFVDMPAFTPGFAKRIGRMGFVPYSKPGSGDLANCVKKLIAKYNGLLLQNHGIVTVGSDLEEALALSEEIEENAQLYFLTYGHPSARVLSPEDMGELIGKPLA